MHKCLGESSSNQIKCFNLIFDLNLQIHVKEFLV
jgi:hypothetical protein